VKGEVNLRENALNSCQHVADLTLQAGQKQTYLLIVRLYLSPIVTMKLL